MTNMLTRKLELFGALPEADRQLLDEITRKSHVVPARQTLIREGDAPDVVYLVLDGFACRCKFLSEGTRQIFAYLLPGDFCDLHVFVLREMDHNIETISDCTVVEMPRDTVLEMASRPTLMRALWWATMVDEAILREWIVNIGQRNAEQRIAHLFCEIHLRLEAIGLTNGGKLELPITQSEMADTAGLSTVHINRSMQSLRAADLIEFKSKMLTIKDIGKLRKMCGFNPNYLHLTGGKYDNGRPSEPAPASPVET